MKSDNGIDSLSGGLEVTENMVEMFENHDFIEDGWMRSNNTWCYLNVERVILP